MKLLFIFQIIFLQAKCVYLGGIPLDFILFGLILAGIAVFHKHATKVAVSGLLVIIFYKIFYQQFSITDHLLGTPSHSGEWSTLLNLFGLLTGFAILSRHFEESNVTHYIPDYLPRGWMGNFTLLIIIFVLSSFLDNIAAALIGGTIALNLYKEKVHIGFLAAIVAASNAGGAGSVIGDTTTTMMWIDGVDASNVFHAYAGAVSALFIFGIIASKQQEKLTPIIKIGYSNHTIDFKI